MKQPRILALAGVVALLAAACSGGGSSGSAAPSPQASIGAGERDPLTLAARELDRLPLADVGQAHASQHVLDPGLAVAAGNALDA
jgi:hypothetical protein